MKINEYNDMMAYLTRPARVAVRGGGQIIGKPGGLVEPGVTNYAEEWVTPLHRKFEGQKFISVPDPTYSERRSRVKTKAYEAFLAKARTVEKGEEEMLELYKKLKKSLKRNPTVWEMHSKGKTRFALTRIKRILEKNKLNFHIINTFCNIFYTNFHKKV